MQDFSAFMFVVHTDNHGCDLRLLGERASFELWRITHLPFRMAFTWGNVWGGTLWGRGWTVFLAESNLQAKWLGLGD